MVIDGSNRGLFAPAKPFPSSKTTTAGLKTQPNYWVKI
jgi:hypothetical protein